MDNGHDRQHICDVTDRLRPVPDSEGSIKYIWFLIVQSMQVTSIDHNIPNQRLLPISTSCVGKIYMNLSTRSVCKSVPQKSVSPSAVRPPLL